MPFRPPRPCRTPGCPALVRGVDLYCPQHRGVDTRAYDLARGTAAQRGYGGAWRKLRKAFLAAHPLCCDPFGIHAKEGRVALATDVDHIQPKRDGGADDWDNLRGLCHSCHSRRTASDGRVHKISGAPTEETVRAALNTHPRNSRGGV